MTGGGVLGHGGAWPKAQRIGALACRQRQEAAKKHHGGVADHLGRRRLREGGRTCWRRKRRRWLSVPRRQQCSGGRDVKKSAPTCLERDGEAQGWLGDGKRWLLRHDVEARPSSNCGGSVWGETDRGEGARTYIGGDISWGVGIRPVLLGFGLGEGGSVRGRLGLEAAQHARVGDGGRGRAPHGNDARREGGGSSGAFGVGWRRRQQALVRELGLAFGQPSRGGGVRREEGASSAQKEKRNGP